MTTRAGLNKLLQSTELTQRDVEVKLAAQFSPGDKLYAEAALNIAIDKGIFIDGSSADHHGE